MSLQNHQLLLSSIPLRKVYKRVKFRDGLNSGLGEYLYYDCLTTPIANLFEHNRSLLKHFIFWNIDPL